ncbi:MAG TPA: hypothetical protein VGW40_12670 [Allosphingosinicella sp.]|nr:hypothetical protein [Allosphingosinicella sp.]
MAEITFTLREVLDKFVKPTAVRFDAKVPYDAFIIALEQISKLLGKNLLEEGVDIPIPDLPRAAGEAGKVVADALSPIDPAKALAQIAKAVSEAEKAFNVQNLAVMNGKVNVQLMVNVGGVAGAQANFDLTIGPTPQG